MLHGVALAAEPLALALAAVWRADALVASVVGIGATRGLLLLVVLHAEWPVSARLLHTEAIQVMIVLVAVPAALQLSPLLVR